MKKPYLIPLAISMLFTATLCADNDFITNDALHPVPVSEVRKADGSLTCQSILCDFRPG